MGHAELVDKLLGELVRVMVEWYGGRGMLTGVHFDIP